MIWPPDFQSEFKRRIELMKAVDNDVFAQQALKVHYRNNWLDFIKDWCVTYNPRNQSPLPKLMPFMLFQKQIEQVHLLKECFEEGENALIEKCRDMGASWVGVAVSKIIWLFYPESSVGWGSRKEMLVDRLGDPSAVFPKIRQSIEYLPSFLKPKGFEMDKHGLYLRIINPENGSVITGEAGKNIGRGGRTSIYFKDESAHYDNPELIEAALGDNTDSQIDISSVNGTGNVFYRRRQAGQIWEPGKRIESGVTRVFIMDWRDHPAKTQEWYDRRRRKFESEGLLHVFAQEVDRDYSSAVEGVIIKSIWVKAAIDAHIKLGIDPHGSKIAALDVADGGGDKSAVIMRDGILAYDLDTWAEADDTGISARRAYDMCIKNSTHNLQYDSVGVGSGVKAEANRMKREGKDKFKFVPWGGGESVQHPDRRIVEGDKESPKHKQVYANLKSQAWGEVKRRFEKTYRAITYGEKYEPEELISICSKIPLREQLVNELSQPTATPNGKGLVVVDKKPNGAKSPNLADAFVMAFWPVEKKERSYRAYVI